MVRDTIRQSMTQFAFTPRVENGKLRGRYKKYIIAGMGGSHLAADLLRAIHPELSFSLHKDYGVPPQGQSDRRQTLLIASSYSGNTEETLDAYRQACRLRLPTIAISTGGRLLATAKKLRTRFIRLPVTGIQPRQAYGFSFQAIAAALGRDDIVRNARERARKIRPLVYERNGKALAQKLYGCIPLVYSSARNAGAALNWKVRLNETAKIPAFWNVLPEMNHNEMTGFDVAPRTRQLSTPFAVVLLRDAADHPRVQRRMRVLASLLRSRGLRVYPVPLSGRSRFEQVITSLIRADWTSYYLAIRYRVQPEEVPMVEEFKKRMI